MRDLQQALRDGAAQPVGAVSMEDLAERASRRRTRRRQRVGLACFVVLLVVGASATVARRDSGDPAQVTASSPPLVTATTAVSGDAALWAVDMVNESTIYAGGKGGRIVRSDDGGRTWTAQAVYCSVCPGFPNVADIDMLSATTGWAATALGLFQTTDGKTWRDRWTGLDHEPSQVQFVSPAEGWIVTSPWGAGEYIGQHEAVLGHTVDGGTTWVPVASPPDTQAVCFASRDDGWLVTRNEIYRTTDTGASWQLSFTPQVDAMVSGVECTPEGGVWAQFVGPDSRVLYSTTTLGATWQEVPISSASTILAPAGPSDAFVVQVTDGDITFRAVHDGTSVAPAVRVASYLDPAQLDPVDVSFADNLHGVIVGDTDTRRPAVLRTNDGGLTWEPAAAAAPIELYEDCPSGRTSEQFNAEQGRYTVLLTGIDASARTLQFDVLEHLVGDEAKAAYQADNPGTTDGPSDGGYNRNRSASLYTAPVAAEVRVRLVRLHETGNASLKPGSFDELPTYLSGYKVPGTNTLSGNVYWVSIIHSQIIDICEQYHP